MAADISSMTYGMSVQKVSEYYEALKVGAINVAVEACKGAAYDNLIKALDDAWVGTSHDKFIEILEKSANITANTIQSMEGALATEINRIIEVWRDHEDKMITD